MNVNDKDLELREHMREDNMDVCTECGGIVDCSDMLWSHDCHGIPFRKLCIDCYNDIMENKGYDGEYYTDADECLDYDY